ncbi:MAG: DUF1385 domain-containing protein [Coriobacteriales bacterium]|jgi:uncharacterized protein YqhQ|nr:DUF1385 domain-containing protein [Coriobacteriales bacterium]
MARAKDTEGVVCQTHVGGQALIEGIMMRGKFNWAVAVREPDGNIYVEEHDLASGKDKNSWLHKPVIRGCTALGESLALGFKALEIAADHAFDLEEEEAPEKPAPAPAPEAAAAQEHSPDSTEETISRLLASVEPEIGRADKPQPVPAIESTVASADEPVEHSTAFESEDCADAGPAKSASPATSKTGAAGSANAGSSAAKSESAIPKPVMTASMIVGVLLGIGIFVALPAVLTNLMVGDYGEKTLLWNIIDGILRIAIFIAYIWLIGRMKDIQRMFGYHGAEHKTIHCYEHGLELKVANARQFPTLHVRCGTAFMLMTMLIAILVFTIVPVGLAIDALGVTNGILRLLLVILSRIILIPLIAGLSYEITVKWAGAHPENPLVQVVLWPGLQLQRLTTNEPDDGMLECAIAAMQRILRREELEQAIKSVDAEFPADFDATFDNLPELT